MTTNRQRVKRRIRLVCGVAACLAATSAWAGGIITPLYVGNLEPVLDQYGRPMPGSNLPAEAAGRSLLELRTSTIDVIARPPTVTGAPHPYNPLLAPDSVGGVGMNTASEDTGLFSMSLSNRPSAGIPVFGRVFNAPTVAEASFYADSGVEAVPAQSSSVVLQFAVAKPLDGDDDDDDGLNNSWEKALGTDDRLTPDYDGDGMTDYHEMLAGTVATDADSNMSFSSIDSEVGPAPAGGRGMIATEVEVRWHSVPGKTYQLQYGMELPDVQEFIDVGDPVTAGEDEFEIVKWVDISERAVKGTFRVVLVVEE